MAHLQYMPGDPRLVDQLVYELKSKGIFDQFRKDCIADVDTKPAYQNLRQRVESSVSTFLSRQCWQPDLNKNQLREKLRKHILDGNYLEQGVERIVDQVVNPKVASIFIPQVEDLVYNYLGITRKKTAETSNEKLQDLLPTDLEAVSPDSVKSNDDKNEAMEMDEVKEETKMEIDEVEAESVDLKEDNIPTPEIIETEKAEKPLLVESSPTTVTIIDSDSEKSNIPLPVDDVKTEDIPSPQDTPPKIVMELAKIELPKEIASTDIPLPDEIHKDAKDDYYKSINSDEDESSSDSSIRRNMSPLTPIRNFNNENSCDAQQAFENNSHDNKNNEKIEPSTFRFAIDTKTSENNSDPMKTEKKDKEQVHLSYQFNEQINLNNFNTPMYDDSSNSNNLQIDYESDLNSKANIDLKATEEQSMDESKKDRKVEEKKSSHKTSHRSRDASKHSISKDKRSDSKPSSSRDSSRHDKKSSKDDHNKSKSSHSKSNDRKDSDKKERDSSKHRSSHRSSNHKDSKSHKSSSTSSSHRHSSKHSDEKKTSSSSTSHREKSERSERSSDKSSKERSKDSKSSSHRSDKDRKSSSSKSSSKHEEKDKDKKSKKEVDDHFSLSGRGNPNRRSTDRDSNDGSSSSKNSHNPPSSKSSASQKESKGNSSKSDNTSPSGDSTSPSDKDHVAEERKSNLNVVQPKPIVRVDTRLELPMASPPRLPFVPDVTLKKPKFAANLQEAKKLMKMRKFLDEEQKRMNQEAALLLEFQANVRPSLSQVYSSIPGPELEFACVLNTEQGQIQHNSASMKPDESIRISNPTNALLAVVNAQKIEELTSIESEISNLTESNDSLMVSDNSLNETITPIREASNLKEEEQVKVQSDEEIVDIKNIAEARVPDVGKEIDDTKETVVKDINADHDNDNKCSIEIDSKTKLDDDKTENTTEYFEITVIAEELSESEESLQTVIDKLRNQIDLSSNNNNTIGKETIDINESHCPSDEPKLEYFHDIQTSEAELQREKFSKFLKAYLERNTSNKVYLINCDTYKENVVKGVLETLGTYEIVNYHKNGHSKLRKNKKNIVKNVSVASELSLSFDNNEFESAVNELEMDLKATRQTVLSPVKSECSFELSNDYDAKIDEMVNNASRQQIMEIILGNVMSCESPTKMPKIDYINDSNIESEGNNLKRKITEVETTVNNNRPVLTPKKIRRMSTSDQITSTTEESEELGNTVLPKSIRSKYLGRARRVGLPRPRKSDQPNSPSSDKSVENYEQNMKNSTILSPTPNGKIKTTPRNKIQRYDTSDLYKPKLHYLSRRNNIS